MEWLERMNNALNYVEGNLVNGVEYEQVAKLACTSVYNFQRMFSFITGVPLSEYIRRRKLTLAAFELQNSDIKVIDVALKYGYESPEAFARAFQNIHGVTPTLARSRGVNLKAYPPISFHISIKGDVEVNYRIEEKESFQMFGIERIFTTENDENIKAIPEFWDRILNDGTATRIEKATGETYVGNYGEGLIKGVCSYCTTGGNTFPYMIGAFRTKNSNTSEYTVIDIPAATWAIFTSEDYLVEDISTATQSLAKRIYSEWLPTAAYENESGHEIEVYGTRENGMWYTEIWIKVREK